MTNADGSSKSIDRLRRLLFKPVDVASIVYFRIMFGCIMMWEIYRYLDFGWVKRYYLDPETTFQYYGFHWVKPLPSTYLYSHFYLTGLVAFFITVGFCYRISCITFFFQFSYIFLLCKTRYLNHLYLVCWISFIMIFIPANRAFSVDAWVNPALKKQQTIPAWVLYVVQMMVGIPYFFGGVAKINSDWMYYGEPMRIWLNGSNMLAEYLTHPALPYLFAWAGLLLDLGIVFFLLYPPTRNFAYASALGFHLTNAFMFSIGIFPWFMIYATLMYYPAAWPRKVWRRIQGDDSKEEEASAVEDNDDDETPSPSTLRRQHRTMMYLGILVAFHFLFPLRHLLYPGHVGWTEQGHDFSWHMKLRTKRTGLFRYRLYNKRTAQTTVVDPSLFASKLQLRKIPGRPEMILQLARRIVDYVVQESGRSITDYAIYADIFSSLNGRPQQRYVDPNADLLHERNTWTAKKWIVPLMVGFNDPPQEDFLRLQEEIHLQQESLDVGEGSYSEPPGEETTSVEVEMDGEAVQ